jgi:hypothetical protein
VDGCVVADAKRRPDSSKVSRIAVIRVDSSCRVSTLPPGKTCQKQELLFNAFKGLSRGFHLHGRRRNGVLEDFDEQGEFHFVRLRSPDLQKAEAAVGQSRQSSPQT